MRLLYIGKSSLLREVEHQMTETCMYPKNMEKVMDSTINNLNSQLDKQFLWDDNGICKIDIDRLEGYLIKYLNRIPELVRESKTPTISYGKFKYMVSGFPNIDPRQVCKRVTDQFATHYEQVYNL